MRDLLQLTAGALAALSVLIPSPTALDSSRGASFHDDAVLSVTEVSAPLTLTELHEWIGVCGDDIDESLDALADGTQCFVSSDRLIHRELSGRVVVVTPRSIVKLDEHACLTDVTAVD